MLPAAPAQATAPATQALHYDACPDCVPRPAAPDRVGCGRISAALGERTPNFPGASYGTCLGAAYVARSPHCAGRMVGTEWRFSCPVREVSL